MAKFLGSAVVGDVRNKIGGVVFTKSRFGAVLRRKVSPVQPRTSYQTSVRALFTLLSKNWGSVLTSTQRAGWIALAQANPVKDVFGNSQILTGLQMYQKINRNLQTIGQAIIDDAPVSLTVGAPGTIQPASTVGPPITLTVDASTEPGTNDTPVVFAAAPLSPGRAFVGAKYRLIGTFAVDTAGPWDIAADYATKFGALVSGQNISVMVKYIDQTTGAASQSATAQIVIPSV